MLSFVLFSFARLLASKLAVISRSKHGKGPNREKFNFRRTDRQKKSAGVELRLRS